MYVNSGVLALILFIGIINALLLIFLLIGLSKFNRRSFFPPLKGIWALALYLLGSQTFTAIKGQHIRHSSKKLSKHLWLSAWAGTLYLTVAGFYYGRVCALGPGLAWLIWLITVALGVGLLVLLVWLYRKAIKAPQIPLRKTVSFLGVAALLTLLCFAIGFGLCGYFWHFMGQRALSRVRQEIAIAGYSPAIPPVGLKLPDSENAVYYLKKNQELRSADTLFYSNDPVRRGKVSTPFYQWRYESDDPFHSSRPVGKPSQDKRSTRNESEQSILNRFLLDMKKGEVVPVELALVRKLVEEHLETLRLIDEAYGKKVDWGTDFLVKPDSQTSFSQIYNLNTMGQLLAAQAYFQSRQGLSKEALRSLKEIIFLGDVCRQTSDSRGRDYDQTLFTLTLDTFREVFPSLDPVLVKKEFLPALNLRERETDFRKSLFLKLFSGDEINEIQSDISWLDYARYLSEGHIGLFGKASTTLGYLTGLTYWPFLEFDLASFYKFELANLKTYDLPYSKRNLALNAASREHDMNKWFLDNSMRFQDTQGVITAYGRVAMVAVESKLFRAQHKRWPYVANELGGNPEDLKDPFADNADLKIKPFPGGVVIYSLGPNGNDFLRMELPKEVSYQTLENNIGWILR